MQMNQYEDIQETSLTERSLKVICSLSYQSQWMQFGVKLLEVGYSIHLLLDSRKTKIQQIFYCLM